MKFDVMIRCCIAIFLIVFSLNIFAQATGDFQTRNPTGNCSDFNLIPGSGCYGATANFIESRQAFFASTLGENTSLTFGEEIKGSSTNSTIPFTPVGGIGQQLRTNVKVVNQDGSVILADGIMHQFADIYDNRTDGKDALKFQVSGETLAF